MKKIMIFALLAALLAALLFSACQGVLDPNTGNGGLYLIINGAESTGARTLAPTQLWRVGILGNHSQKQ